MITAVNIDKSTSIGGVLTTFEEVVIMVVVVEEVVGAGGIITEQAPSSPRLKMWYSMYSHLLTFWNADPLQECAHARIGEW